MGILKELWEAALRNSLPELKEWDCFEHGLKLNQLQMVFLRCVVWVVLEALVKKLVWYWWFFFMESSLANSYPCFVLVFIKYRHGSMERSIMSFYRFVLFISGMSFEPALSIFFYKKNWSCQSVLKRRFSSVTVWVFLLGGGLTTLSTDIIIV